MHAHFSIVLPATVSLKTNHKKTKQNRTGEDWGLMIDISFAGGSERTRVRSESACVEKEEKLDLNEDKDNLEVWLTQKGRKQFVFVRCSVFLQSNSTKGLIWSLCEAALCSI